MPYIAIKTDKLPSGEPLEHLNKMIAQRMEVNRERIILSWEVFEKQGFYRHSETEETETKPVVIIRLSKRNGDEFMKKLAGITVEELSKLLDIPKENIILFIHPIEIGNTYLNGQFV